MSVNEGDLLWTPGAERFAISRLPPYLQWLERERGLKFADYEALWQWSVRDLEAFWQSLWDYFKIQSGAPHSRVLANRKMPGADWFPGARLNYAEHILRNERPDAEAFVHFSERTPLTPVSWTELGARVRIVATELRAMGLRPGDRVAGYLPNGPEAVVALLATTSIGAIWSACGPDFGTRGVLDRFTQLAPKVIFCVDGYQYAGKPFSRKAELREILAGLPSIEHVVYLPYLNAHDREPIAKHCVLWQDLIDRPPVAAKDFSFERVPFNHPLWILFSSGTTGLPKAIVHGHGGILLEQLKLMHFHMDVPRRGRMFFFTTTGWMMWNFMVSSMLADVVPVLYDGNPAWPEPDILWKAVEQSGACYFGASPTYQQIQEKNGIVPRERYDLSKLLTITLAGSPVSPECMLWFYENVKKDLWVQTGSGGTDVCTGFTGGVQTQPVYAGEMQARSLGIAAYAFNAKGESVIDEVGELVITEPMPSMPVSFWNDPDGRKYLESYFQEYPGIWRHGDFFRVNRRGGCFVSGRSDATLNRHGIRIGTAEIYRSLATLPGVDDSLIVSLDLPGGHFFMPLFVKLANGAKLDAGFEERIRRKLRSDYSPRHVPDKIYQVDDIPLTLTGKKLEVPVRRILMGVAPEKAVNRDAVANPRALDFFVDYAARQRDYSLTPGHTPG
ncbi:MAG TPA: acetoacetate--CoA ligase [Steroidobacteraceae bacterium]|nr:acetoacetate--CoA ligase [Steroidobacteraceae bacterium]